MKYWLMKSEPDCFSIDDLKARPEQTEPWDGVRNYQVRNMFRDQFQKGDLAFFYHSSCAVPGIVGIMSVVSTAYPDPTQFDPKADHYDAKSKPEEPRWLLVDVKFVEKWKQPLSLPDLKQHADGKLKDFRLLARGNRLSIMPVEAKHWRAVQALRK